VTRRRRSSHATNRDSNTARVAGDGSTATIVMPGCAWAIATVIRPVPLARFTRIAVGGHDYEGWAAAAPAGPDRLRWTMTYRTLRGDRLIDERVAESLFLTLDPTAMAAEARAAGLAVEQDAEGLLILRAPAR
jgi:hypothetical protein